MDLDIFDIDVTLGTPAVPLDDSNGFFCSEQEILKEFDRFSIRQGAVRHIAGKEYSPVYGNAELEKLTSNRLEKCVTLLPQQTGEMKSGTILTRELSENRTRFAAVYPHTHHFHLSPHICGSLFHLLAEAGVTLLIEKNEIAYENIYEVCTEIPELHVIILGAAYRQGRTLYPLLEYLDNVSIALSGFCGKDFIEDVVDRFGPERLVFSSGLPVFNPASPLMALAYADISEDAKKMIAGDNIRSLMGGIDES